MFIPLKYGKLPHFDTFYNSFVIKEFFLANTYPHSFYTIKVKTKILKIALL